MRLIAAALTMVFLASASSQPTLTKRQAEELAREASSPEEHLKFAEYYRAQGNGLIEESRTWAAMADDYDRNPASHPIPKFPTYGEHCRSLSRQYLKDARKAEALALAHERLAAPSQH